MPITVMSLTKEECQLLIYHYQQALTSRIDAHKTKNAAKSLLELDDWRLNDLSATVRKRDSPFMTKEELEKLMDCKLYTCTIYH